MWPGEKLPTDYQAECYLERYPDVLQEIGSKRDLTATKMHWMTAGKDEGRTMKCGLGKKAGMTDQQITCYKERYGGKLKTQSNKDIEKGWYGWGRKFGRNKYCAPRITLIQSYCMLARSDDLMEKFAGVFQNAEQGIPDYRMQKYWEVKGYFEERDYSCGNLGAALLSCAKDGGECNCPHGDVYYVKTKRDG